MTLRYDWRYELRHYQERLMTWIAWHLPRTLVYWCCVRVAAHATTGAYGNTHPATLSVMDALKRWETPNNG